MASADRQAAPRIEKVLVRDNLVELRWNEGRADQHFTLLWLRDHCRCAACHHPETRQRLHDTFAIPADLSAREVVLEDHGQTLRIEWAPQQHTSRYEANFLAGLQVDPEVLPVRRRLWDAATLTRDVPAVRYEALLTRDEVLRDFLEHVESDGFAFVEGTPATPEATKAVAARVAYTRETVFGGYYDFTANLEYKDTAYTSLAIGAHTDGTYSFDAPGYQMFHCLAADCTGGENVLMDGFRIAELMAREHTEDYQVLTEVPVVGQYLEHERGIHLMARRPVFRLDSRGQLVQISYNNHDRAPFLLPPDQETAFYRALGTFARLLREPRFQYRRRLLPGSVLLFDNWRVLHARDAYTGYRRLAGVYLNKEDVESRLRVLRMRASAPGTDAA
jgi:trimethyllysine dioxygenase